MLVKLTQAAESEIHVEQEVRICRSALVVLDRQYAERQIPDGIIGLQYIFEPLGMFGQLPFCKSAAAERQHIIHGVERRLVRNIGLVLGICRISGFQKTTLKDSYVFWRKIGHILGCEAASHLLAILECLGNKSVF